MEQNLKNTNKKKWSSPFIKNLNFNRTAGGENSSWAEDAFQAGYELTPSI